MSGRLLASGLAPLARRINPNATRRLAYHARARGAGLLRGDSRTRLQTRWTWPSGASSVHNVPTVRTVSFARAVPSLFMKVLRLPAMFGGAAIAGFAYIQYQAARKSCDQVGSQRPLLISQRPETTLSTYGNEASTPHPRPLAVSLTTQVLLCNRWAMDGKISRTASKLQSGTPRS